MNRLEGDPDFKWTDDTAQKITQNILGFNNRVSITGPDSSSVASAAENTAKAQAIRIPITSLQPQVKLSRRGFFNKLPFWVGAVSVATMGTIITVDGYMQEFEHTRSLEELTDTALREGAWQGLTISSTMASLGEGADYFKRRSTLRKLIGRMVPYEEYLGLGIGKLKMIAGAVMLAAGITAAAWRSTLQQNQG